MKTVLFAVAMMISVYAGAVEFGQYRPAGQPVTTTTSSVGYTPAAMPSVSFRSTSAYSPMTTISGGLYGGQISGGGDGNSGTAARGPRRAPSGEGYSGQVVYDGGWYIWDDDLEGWRSVVNGDTKIEGGVAYTWNGSEWVRVDEQKDPDQPVGAMPWMLMLLLCGGYAAAAAYRRREEIRG